MSIVSIQQYEPEFTDIAATLRRIADDIESGEHEGPISTAVLVFGHTGRRRLENGEFADSADMVVFGMGPRSDVFTVRGILATAMQRV